MRPLEAGSPRRRLQGFTLIEVLMVLTIIAIASVGVTLALPNQDRILLEREAQRLGAAFESARAQARMTGKAVHWRQVPGSGTYQFEGLAQQPMRELGAGIGVANGTDIALGPEPIIGPQSAHLYLRDQPQIKLHLVTDGIRPFSVSP